MHALIPKPRTRRASSRSNVATGSRRASAPPYENKFQNAASLCALDAVLDFPIKPLMALACGLSSIVSLTSASASANPSAARRT